MAPRLLLAATAAMLLALPAPAGAARSDDPVLTGDVGANDGYVIGLTANGAKVTHLDPGSYTLVLRDHSTFHDFHLSGPGVDVTTSVDAVEDKTFTVTLTDGTYFFQCDPHAGRMRGSFTVGTVQPPAPAPTPKPAAPARLAGAIGPGATVTLGPLGSASAGKTTITVRDRTASDGFRLAGPGVQRSTGVGFRGAVTWTVTLKPGRYSFGSVRHPKARRSFTIS